MRLEHAHMHVCIVKQAAKDLLSSPQAHCTVPALKTNAPDGLLYKVTWWLPHEQTGPSASAST